ncbi:MULTISPECIES: hypothetical protein [unclassified Psychrobacter]|uniref:hypothetical protein n=1 Tax=unclassified Psychrobacter TaxID=196806 RepID=UPI0007144C51|nr:hypothetical protein [Psychrobacter sp. P11F6]KRG34227.1 hypothetical protein AK822_04780 [Psychrobacter sp. P11F6]
MASITGEVIYEWYKNDSDKNDFGSDYDVSDLRDVFSAQDFSLEESGKRSDDLFIQMYIGFIYHPFTNEEGKIFLEVGLDRHGTVEWVEGPNPEGPFRIIESNLQVLGADLRDDDFDDFADENNY